MSEPIVLDRRQIAASGSADAGRADGRGVRGAARGVCAREHPSLARRRDRLDRLLHLTETHQSAIIDAISADFGHRSRHETDLADIFVVMSAIRHTRRHLRRMDEAAARPDAAASAARAAAS